MGYGGWSADTYGKTTASKIASGRTFAYSASARATGVYKAHEDLDPTKKNAAGKLVREARDSVDHPNSVPIVVAVDETGSMASTPKIFQKKLAGLFGLLTRKGYVEDPQIMVAAYGDAFCDQAPLQVSQFESDNRVDDALDNLFLEGNGGANGGETATLLWYYLANHTETDAWDKRGKKGYFFFVADERALDLTGELIKKFIGADEPVGDLTAEGIAKALTKKWDTYVLLIDNSSAKWQGSQKQYETLFGRDHVLIVENDETISETIGAALGRLEQGDLDDDEIIDDMLALGTTRDAAEKATKAIAKLGGGGGGRLATTNANLGLADDDAPVIL